MAIFDGFSQIFQKLETFYLKNFFSIGFYSHSEHNCVYRTQKFAFWKKNYGFHKIAINQKVPRFSKKEKFASFIFSHRICVQNLSEF